MIIKKSSLPRRFGKAAVIIAGLHMLILAAYIAITLVPGIAQAVTVIMPDVSFRHALQPKVRVISWDGWTAQLASSDPNFVRELYQAGAIIVLPTLDTFCLSLGGEKPYINISQLFPHSRG